MDGTLWMDGSERERERNGERERERERERGPCYAKSKFLSTNNSI
jgi:hypothetical protein